MTDSLARRASTAATSIRSAWASSGTTRDDVIRPTRGWRLILKAAHTDRALQSDFEFTRLVGDIGYLVPLLDAPMSSAFA